ncbi:YcjX family protein [Roseococcus microcysteis]|uniref:YcjX family protein n=1 Tax=Roseococcus microcysteis TaxID=2771361 RepID=UPI00168A743B|nr:YcjX family protein [Roseococcus microcysteis]
MARDLRLCVTGLSRAGKTAFITALVHALCIAPRVPQAFPAWGAARTGRLVHARPVPPQGAVQAIEAFPYEANLAALRAESPHWPEATNSVRAITLELTLERPPGLALGALDRVLRRAGAKQREKRRVTILDYPGEWALDLPMLDQDFAAWSQATLAAMARPPRAALAGPALAAINAINPGQPYSDEAARAAHQAFVEFLEAARTQGRLALLQPGLFLRPEKVGGRAAILAQEDFRFFPLPASAKRPPAGSFAAVLARRYDAYRRDHVRGFFDSLRGPGTTRQVVLFDLLGALSSGQQGYADATAALTQVAQAMRPRMGVLARFFGGAVRVLYAATKADYLPPQGRQRLRAHLDMLLGGLAGNEGGREQFRSLALSAIAATRDGTDAEGRPLVAGCVRDRATGALDCGVTFRFPAPPAGPPTARDWTAWEAAGLVGFDWPEFLPDPESLRARHDLPHLGLDEALDFLLDGHA